MLCLNVSYIAISTIKRVVSEDSLLYYIDLIIFKTQELCEEAVDDSLAALKLIPDSFVTIKRLKKKINSLYADENILYFNEDSSNAVLICKERVFLILILIILILIIVLMKMIVILLLLSDFWLGILNLK